MKPKIAFYLLGLALLPAAVASAQPDLDPAAKFACRVIESNDRNVLVGAETINALSMKTLERGVIALKSGTDTSLIDFYGSLKPYDLLAVGSGQRVYAVPPTEPREITGSIVVEAQDKGSFLLNVKLFPTTRAFDAAGGQAFLLADKPQVYKLTCLAR